MEKKYSREEWRNLKLSVTLSRCSASVNRRIYPKIKEKGITESQFSVLELLFHKGEMTVKEIVEKTFSSGGNITVVMNNLLKEELVQRKKCRTDKRVWQVSLTDDGIGLMEEIFAEHTNTLKDTFEVLTEGEQMIMIELLKKLGKGREI